MTVFKIIVIFFLKQIMKQVKTSDKMLIVDRIMSIFLWNKIFRAIFALLPQNNFSRAPMHEMQYDLNNDIKDLQNILKIFQMNRNRFRLRWEQSPPNHKRAWIVVWKSIKKNYLEVAQTIARTFERPRQEHGRRATTKNQKQLP